MQKHSATSLVKTCSSGSEWLHQVGTKMFRSLQLLPNCRYVETCTDDWFSFLCSKPLVSEVCCSSTDVCVTMWDHPRWALLSCNGAWRFTAGGWHGTLTGNGQVKVINKYTYQWSCRGFLGLWCWLWQKDVELMALFPYFLYLINNNMQQNFVMDEKQELIYFLKWKWPCCSCRCNKNFALCTKTLIWTR